MGSEGRDNSSAAHYETLNAKLTSNSRPVYEQIKTATTIDVGQYNISEGATQESPHQNLCTRVRVHQFLNYSSLH